ncbi:hypothetical protein [Nostoc sp.]|uniref:hypothetical protein n=1 Tax=Nostoc sp. TaxID=1180 RepID=UPI002FF4BC20
MPEFLIFIDRHKAQKKCLFGRFKRLTFSKMALFNLEKNKYSSLFLSAAGARLREVQLTTPMKNKCSKN